MLYVVTIILFLVFYALFCYTYGDDYLSAIRWLCCIAMAAVLVYPGIKLSVFWEIPPIWASIIAMALYLALYFLGAFINYCTTFPRYNMFIFEDDALQDDDKRWNTAYYREPTKFRDGIVYVHPSKWSLGCVVIARYRHVHSGIVVEDPKTRKQIGAVHLNQIYLSRDHEAFLRQKADKRLSGMNCPEPSKIVAVLTLGIIEDAKTRQRLGQSDQFDISADVAAAFIALTSTFHTHTKYANYQVDWEFEE